MNTYNFISRDGWSLTQTKLQFERDIDAKAMASYFPTLARIEGVYSLWQGCRIPEVKTIWSEKP